MRCPNCQTVLMATDTRCLVCGMATGRGRSATRLEVRAAFDRKARSKYFARKWGLGLPLLVAGAIAGAIGGEKFLDSWNNHPKPRQVTAADLIKVRQIADEPGWLAFVPAEAPDTEVGYVKFRGGQTSSTFVLLKAGER